MDQHFTKRIILSEDIGRAFDRIDCFIQRSAFQVHVARSGEEIVDSARREPPDAVVMNYYLPVMKGDEVCRLLKRSGSGTAPAPSTLIVGPSRPAEIPASCREAGCDDFVATPAGPNVLLQRLAGLLGIGFRLHARVPAVISISFGRIVTEFLGHSKDISEGGIRIETGTPFDPGKRLYLRLFLDEGHRPVIARATVLRVDPVPEEEQYLLGMQFQPLDPDSAARIRTYIQTRAQHETRAQH